MSLRRAQLENGLACDPSNGGYDGSTQAGCTGVSYGLLIRESGPLRPTHLIS